MLPKLLAASALIALTACGETSTSWDRELGSEVDKGQFGNATMNNTLIQTCLLYTSPSPRDRTRSRMPSSA